MEPPFDLLIDNRYKLLPILPQVSASKVYAAEDIVTSSEVVIKLAPHESRGIAGCLEQEIQLYRVLGRIPGIPRMMSTPSHEYYRILVLERLGCNLGDLLHMCGDSFSLKTTLLLADQILVRLRTIHNRKMIHRDVRPENFMLGTGRAGNTVYIIDFGISCQVREAPPADDLGLIGTPEYASRSAHHGGGDSEYDDLESLAYMLIQFRTSLPWSACDDHDEVLSMKKKMKAMTVAKGAEPIFSEFLHYTRQRRRRKPSYANWRRRFQAVYRKWCGPHDFVYDWTIVIHNFLTQNMNTSQ